MSVGKSMTVVGIALVLLGFMSTPDTGPAGAWTPPSWWLMLLLGGFLFSIGLGATIGAYDVKNAIKDGRLDPDELKAQAEADDDVDDPEPDVDDDQDPAESLSRGDTMHQ